MSEGTEVPYGQEWSYKPPRGCLRFIAAPLVGVFVGLLVMQFMKVYVGVASTMWLRFWFSIPFVLVFFALWKRKEKTVYR